jgi:hypothetical protein
MIFDGNEFQLTILNMMFIIFLLNYSLSPSIPGFKQLLLILRLLII